MSDFDSRRLELKELNTRAWAGEQTFHTNTKLDSSLKKNTAFIKKIKLINSDQSKSILKDIESLSLEKYLSEIIISLNESLVKVSKNDDIVAAVEIVSALHQRFLTNFTPHILSNFTIGISNPKKTFSETPEIEKEETAKTIKQKNLLRLTMELYLVGVFRTIKDCEKDSFPDSVAKRYAKVSTDPIVIANIKDILNFEAGSGNSLQVVVSFLKRFHHIIYEEHGLLDEETRTSFKKIFDIYCKKIWNDLTDYNTKRNKIMNQNRKSQIRTGKVLEEHTQEFESINSVFEKVKSGAENLSQILDVPLPLLKDDSFEVDESGSTVKVVRNASSDDQVWDDPKEKLIYLDIPSLEDLVEASKDVVPNFSTDGERVNDFISKFERIKDEKDADSLAAEFYKLNLNNKATRNRLQKFFLELSTTDNIKFYARFLRINQEPLKDLIADLIEYLDNGFRSQLHRNSLNFKNIIFFAELIKFKMIPTYMVFHKIRRLTMNICETNNIDILSVMYERCGKFLLHDPENQELMSEMLQLLKDKLKDQKLTVTDKMSIKNLLFIIDPPTVQVSRTRKSKSEMIPPMKYLHHLLRTNLTEKQAPAVLAVLLRIDWVKDQAAQRALVQIMSLPEEATYETIPLLVSILRDLSKGGNTLILVQTIDCLVENIIQGLELNDYRLNRARNSQVKFAAELYNCKCVNFAFIIDLLYQILCLGHPGNQPLPNQRIEIDQPNNYFRIQLCCSLLNSINSITVTGSKKLNSANDTALSKFHQFWVFFQYYCFCKRQPLPIEMEFQIQEVFNKHSVHFAEGELKRYDDFVEILEDLKAIVQKNKMMKVDEDEDEQDVISSAESDIDSDGSVDDIELSSDDDDEDTDESSESSASESEDDEDEEDEADETTNDNADAVFSDFLENEFHKMVSEGMGENMATNRNRNKPSMPVPTQFKRTEELEKAGKIAFGLITRKGKKNDIKQVELPSDSNVVTRMLQERETQKSHRERILHLIQNMD